MLGVSRDADEETIKKAYRSLIKKYHPDKYVNSPLADMAMEKTKEINKAYDMITGKNNETDNQQGYNPFGGGYGGYTYRAGTDSYANVRALLTMNRTLEAEAMLNRMPKNAERYYLMGVICLRKGWYDQGVTNLRRAVELDPNNIEYRGALDNILRRNTTYTNTTSSMGTDCGECTTCPFWCIPCFCPCGCTPCYC